jgi:hypothetical protein
MLRTELEILPAKQLRERAKRKGASAEQLEEAVFKEALIELLLNLAEAASEVSFSLHGIGLAASLQSKHCKLTSLDLCDNELTEAAVAALAASLRSEHCKLTSLDLSYNDLGDATGVALAVSLRSENCNLTNLVLRRNDLGEVGGAALAASLRSEHCTLTSLNLSANHEAFNRLFAAFPWVESREKAGEM